MQHKGCKLRVRDSWKTSQVNLLASAFKMVEQPWQTRVRYLGGLDLTVVRHNRANPFIGGKQHRLQRVRILAGLEIRHRVHFHQVMIPLLYRHNKDVLNTLTRQVAYLGDERLEASADSSCGGGGPSTQYLSSLTNSSIFSLSCRYLFKAFFDKG